MSEKNVESDPIKEIAVVPDRLLYEDKMFPLGVLKPDAEIPQEWLDGPSKLFFLQGQNLFQLTNTPLQSTISHLDDDKAFKNLFGDTTYKPDYVYLPRCNWQDFPFPVDKFRHTMRYFQAIYDQYKSEAAVMLMVHPTKKLWEVLHVVQVSGAGGSVIYAPPVMSTNGLTGKAKDVIESILKNEKALALHTQVYEKYNKLYDDGYRIWGTIHSHCNFHAYHSTTDDADERDFEGLHITVGNCHSGWSYSARYMIATVPFKTDIEEILNVNDMTEVQAGVDEIAISDELMCLMMPDLLPKHCLAVRNTCQQKNNRINRGCSNENKYRYDYGSYSNQGEDHDYGNEYDYNYDPDGNTWDWAAQEWEENVWDETKTVRLFNWETGEILNVKSSWFYSHQWKFKTHQKISTDIDIPEELMQKHQDFLNSTPNDVVDDNITNKDYSSSDAILFNIPALNPHDNKATENHRFSHFLGKWWKGKPQTATKIINRKDRR